MLSSKIDNLLNFIDSCAPPGAGNANSAEEEVAAMPEVQSAVLAALNAQGIQFKSIDHAAVMTSNEHSKVAGHLNGALCKNLFMKKKKKRYLIVFEHSKRIDLKSLGKAIGANDWRQGSDLEQVLKVKGGCVTPLAVMNDENKITQVYLDACLKDAPLLNLHPCVNTSTISITPADLEKFVTSCGMELNYADFGGKVESAPAPAQKQQSKKQQKKQQKKQKKQQKQPKQKKQQKGKTMNKDGMQYTRAEDFGEWYSDLVVKSKLIDYTDISGCYVLRPSSFFIWERIKEYMDSRFVQLGVKNCYFPLFVSESALMKEKDHVEGFTPEVAWVTKSGSSDLAVPIAVRPTSETIMYPLYAKWIRSHQDLPLRLNQWCNVVRWEFKNPTPFLRTREFLWQEGHTAFETEEQAMEEVYQILDIYADTYREICAVPTIKGRKTELEKFPGGAVTTTVEAYVPGSGRAIQGATSHCLGQNFGKMFKINYEKAGADGSNQKCIPWQNSWGFTTRSIGVMIMNHSDDKGLVLPPKVAELQVVIIPILYKEKEQNESILKMAEEMATSLRSAGVRVFVDDGPKKPGFKYNKYELEGTPLRLEVGPKDVAKRSTKYARRDNGAKGFLSIETLGEEVVKILDQMHVDLLEKATKSLYDNIVKCVTWEAFIEALGQGKIVICPSANTDEVEEDIKKRTKAHFDSADHDAKALSGKAKSLCIPFDQEKWGDVSKEKCIASGGQAKKWILYGRTY